MSRNPVETILGFCVLFFAVLFLRKSEVLKWGPMSELTE